MKKMVLTFFVSVFIFFGVAYAVSAGQLGTGVYFWGGTASKSTASSSPYQGTGAFDASTVSVPSGDGELSGYAWGGNGKGYGFMTFNATELVGCPSGECKAKRVGDKIVGWARLRSIQQEGNNSGGWSGWVRLDDDNNDGKETGVRFENEHLVGYGYSNELGFIEFESRALVLKYFSCAGGEVPSALSLDIKQSKSIVACEGTVNVTESVEWSTSDPTTVSITGKNSKAITGIKPGGPIKILAKDVKKGLSDSVDVTVTSNVSFVLKYEKCSGSDVPDNVTLQVGESKNIVACEVDDNVTEKSQVVWTPPSSTFITIVNNAALQAKKITGKSVGNVTVSAKDGEYVNAQDSVDVTVVKCTPMNLGCGKQTCKGQTCNNGCKDEQGELECQPGGFREVTP